MRELVLETIKATAIKYGDFILSSGKKSNYYIDLKLAAMQSDSLFEISYILYHKLKNIEFDSIGGMASGAIPIISALLIHDYYYCNFLKRCHLLHGFWVRSEKKNHGIIQQIEGNLKRKDRVIIIDDVLTTGQSILKVIDAVREMDCTIKSIMVILDRDEGGKELLKDYNVESLFTLKDLGLC